MEQDPDNIESGIGSGIGNNTLVVPENKIILLAVGLAFLETAATGLAYSAFVWSTVVVLGGFATTLETIDFWFVTILSLIEGTRIFRQKREFEWRSNAQSKVQSVPPTGNGKPSIVAIVVGIVSRVLFLLQFVSVITCVFLSLYRLVRQYYGAVLDSSTKNRKTALNIFYGLSLADSVLYVLQNTCLNFSKNYLIPKVTKEYDLNPSEFHIHLYFYDIYSRCINRSFLEGLKMNFLSYNMELLLSSGDDEQLRGAQVLSTLAKTDGFSVETLDAIGAVQEVLERLIEMLQYPHQMYIRIEAARIISNMVSINGHLSKVIAIPRFMESIVSLLYDSKEIEIQYLGLKIVESLVDDKENWAKMESSRDLLPKLIGMTELNPKRAQMQMIMTEQPPMEEIAELAVKLVLEIGTMSGGPIEILNCSDYQKQEIRRDAAKNIFNMVQKKSILIRLRDFTQFIESIGSLLYDTDSIDSQHAGAYDYSSFSLLGLQILKILVEHCVKIKSIIIDLLTKIIGMTKLNSNASAIQIETVKLALELVKMLVQTDPSLTLAEMNKMTFGISNLVSVLQYPERSLHDLQILAIETLKSLVNSGHRHGIKISVSKANQEALGNLFSVLLMVGIYNNEEIAIKAGETLDILSRESRDNCQLMMSTKLGHEQSLILSLISVLDDLSRGIFVARILRNICAYAEADCVYLETDCVEWMEICAAAPQVVKFVMERKDELQEAAIGIAARIFKFIDKSDFDRVFEESSGVTTLSLILVLLKVFRRHPSVSNEVPIRRLSIDLLSTVIEMDKVAILSRMSKEVRLVLRRKLKEGSIQSDVFSFLREPAAVEYFTDS